MFWLYFNGFNPTSCSFARLWTHNFTSSSPLVEFKGLKNQDITIRKLEAKITELEENKEEEIKKELKWVSAAAVLLI